MARSNGAGNLCFADWSLPDGTCFEEPQLVGTLTSNVVRNKELFSFSYAADWLNSPFALPIDPELQLFEGRQFSDENNFWVFLDSCPDRWGRLLIHHLVRKAQSQLSIKKRVRLRRKNSPLSVRISGLQRLISS